MNWLKPSLTEEMDEIIRQAQELGLPDSVLLAAFEEGTLAYLGQDDWLRMENTNSNDPRLTMKEVRSWTHRDTMSIIRSIWYGHDMPAPMILIYGEKLICVAGNTRLSVCKLLGVTPQVLVAEITPSGTETNPNHTA